MAQQLEASIAASAAQLALSPGTRDAQRLRRAAVFTEEARRAQAAAPQSLVSNGEGSHGGGGAGSSGSAEGGSGPAAPGGGEAAALSGGSEDAAGADLLLSLRAGRPSTRRSQRRSSGTDGAPRPAPAPLAAMPAAGSLGSAAAPPEAASFGSAARDGAQQLALAAAPPEPGPLADGLSALAGLSGGPQSGLQHLLWQKLEQKLDLLQAAVLQLALQQAAGAPAAAAGPPAAAFGSYDAATAGVFTAAGQGEGGNAADGSAGASGAVAPPSAATWPRGQKVTLPALGDISAREVSRAELHLSFGCGPVPRVRGMLCWNLSFLLSYRRACESCPWEKGPLIEMALLSCCSWRSATAKAP